MTPTSPTPSPTRLKGLLSSRWLRPLNDPVALDGLLGLVDPTWSLTETRARVVAAIRETADARTLVLRPNGRWQGHLSGQHVLVEVEIAGRRLRRTFSVSSAPKPSGLLCITVKRREGGRVSAWWNETAAVGDVITLGRATGTFVLPAALPPRMVMVSAGSGITPVMAMLRDLEARDHRSEVLFAHSARSRSDALFLGELEAMASRCTWLTLRPRFTDRSARMNLDEWVRLADEAGDAPTFACGPVPFMDEARIAWTRAGRLSSLHFESFGLPPRVNEEGTPESVQAVRTGRSFTAAPGQSLLEAAEAAGLRPANGCRVGVCHTCKCRKLSGVVEDLRDGRTSNEPGEMIQLCVSTARSAVTLEL